MRCVLALCPESSAWAGGKDLSQCQPWLSSSLTGPLKWHCSSQPCFTSSARGGLQEDGRPADSRRSLLLISVRLSNTFALLLWAGPVMGMGFRKAEFQQGRAGGRGRPWNPIVLDLNPATSQAEGSWQAYQHHATGQRAGESSVLEVLHHQGEVACEGGGSQRSLKACSLAGSTMYSMRSLFQVTLTLSVCFLFMKTGLIITHTTKKCCGV